MNTPPRILIVDDDPLNVDFLDQEIRDLGYATLAAGNGQEALEKVREETPDLILLDIMMPVLDGFAVLSSLKADPDLREIPVIVISAAADLKNVVKGIDLGAEDYLPKPFEQSLLKARISACLEKKYLRDLQKLYLKSLERELEIGREIQMSFLPSSLPEVAGWEIAPYFKSAREVAGDFYDSFVLPDGNLAVVVADVCGKGVGAALFMTLFRSLLRAGSTTDHFTNEKRTAPLPPAERLLRAIELTNNYIEETHGATNMFATVFFGIIDPKDGQLTYVNGGNEPALLLGGPAAIELRPTGPVVGMIPGARFSVQQVIIEHNSILLTYTDGIPDSMNREDEFFGRERLINLTREWSGSAGELIDKIRDNLESFTALAEQFDDITMMAVKRGT
ncbi:MAG: response regulator [Chloroflexi bacterium]|nr:response regulator [Chloroflexota bacterium]